MSEDWRVTSRSDEQVRAISERTKIEFKVEKLRPVNIVRCVQSETVKTIYGPKKLVLKLVDNEDLGTVDARTDYEARVVTITCKRNIFNAAKMGDGRSRMTLAHELGHAVMHDGAPKFRNTGATGTTELSKDRPFESAEHQAKVFASAFLIHDDVAATLASPYKISEEFLVSLEAAEICFERLAIKAEREKSAQRVFKIVDEIKTAVAKRYISDQCHVCGKNTLIMLGVSTVHCETCKFTGGRFQDGDKSGDAA